MRCRPAWVAAAAGWFMSTKALPPTSSPWPRDWATDSRSEPASPPEPASRLLGPGSHGSTFGGNPVAAIAGLAVIAVIERDDLLAHAKTLGEHLATAIMGLDHRLIAGVRGRGLLQAVILAEPIAAAVVDAALDAGFVINAPRPDVLRLAPPLIISAAELDGFVRLLPSLLDLVAEESILMRHFLGR